MNINTSSYSPLQDEIVIRFVGELKKNIPQYLKKVILYGSRARGDHKKNSDYDFLVILSQKNLQLNDLVYDAGYSILDSYEKLASCIIWDEMEWNQKKDFSFAKNISRDGISLL